MNRAELREKIFDISNSEFPLIDFFNDISLNDNEYFDTERAYKDIEKIFNVFVYYKNKCKQLEKENQGVKDDNTRLWHSLECANNEISKFKTAINILNKFNFKVETTNCNRTGYEMYTDSLLEYEPLTKEEYDLLKEVLESVGDSDEV